MSGTPGSETSSREAVPEARSGDAQALLNAAVALRGWLAKNPELRQALGVFCRYVLHETEHEGQPPPGGIGARPQAAAIKVEPSERVEVTLTIGGISRDVAVPVPTSNIAGAVKEAVRHLESPLVGPRVVMRESADVPGLLSSPRDGNWDQPSRVDGKRVAERCRLKAQGCRWVVEQRKLMQSGVSHQDERIRSARESLVARAKAMNPCYLWMIDPRGPALPDY